ncbi:DUF2497 domain-containing protein [Altererythrobacter sp. B11]|uniref:DUF2497 domain-containing protein n=1 Tax=Altererythrobacter sp. B11 TaxID=2060312 RepID=UPI000E5B2D9F|nr:DUF2497 domain-containing protein [Altererythrobacter sp. B11]
MRQDGEPSVEEILESIKKVIARDNRESALAERRRRENSGLPREAPEAARNSVHDAEGVLELGEAAEMVDSDEALRHRPADHSDDEGESGTGEPGLTNAAAATAMRESLAALAMIARPGAQPQIVRSGETSLEGMAREMLRPMLAQWLDTHLPGIVERMVKDEIARIAGKKG